MAKDDRRYEDLEKCWEQRFYVLVTGSGYLLTGLDYPDQPRHKDFEVREDRSLGSFLLDSESRGICLLIFPASYTCVHYAMAEKKKRTGLLRLTEVAIPAYSIFIAHWYLLHGECFWLGSQTVCYHTRLIQFRYDLKTAVTFVYGASFSDVNKPAI